MSQKVKLTGGPIRVYDVDKATGIYTQIMEIPHNQVQFEGADIIAKLMSGDTMYALNTMYFEFNNTSVKSMDHEPAADDGQAYWAGLTPGTYDYMKADIVINPTLTATSGSYSHNKVTFLGLIDDGTGEVNSLAFSNSALSEVSGIALVSSPTGVLAENLVYGRVDIGGATGANNIVKIDNHQIAYAYDVTIT